MASGFVVFARGVRTDAGTVHVAFVRGRRFAGRLDLPAGVSPYVPNVEIRVRAHGIVVGTPERNGARWWVDGVPDGTWPVQATLELGDKTYEANGTASPDTETVLELR
jgi:hypothetical protein